MKNHFLLAMFIGTAVASLFSIQPCAAAAVQVSSVYYQPGTSSATRQPRSAMGGKFVTIPGTSYSPDPDLVPPLVNVSTAPQQKLEITSGTPPTTATYALAFVNVSGGADGGISVFPDTNGTMPTFIQVPVQTPPQDINVVNVYFPVGGSSCPPNKVCNTAASIDEFRETSGGLINDTFVNVFTPPTSTQADSALTKTANVNGEVDTTNNNVRINALNPPVAYQATPTGGVFDKWVTGPGGKIGTNAQDLDVSKQTNDYALALYSSCPDGYSFVSGPTISQCKQNKTHFPPPHGLQGCCKFPGQTKASQGCPPPTSETPICQ